MQTLALSPISRADDTGSLAPHYVLTTQDGACVGEVHKEVSSTFTKFALDWALRSQAASNKKTSAGKSMDELEGKKSILEGEVQRLTKERDGDEGAKGLIKEVEEAAATKTRLEEEVRNFTQQLEGKDGNGGIKGLKKEIEEAKAAKTKVEEETRDLTEQLNGRDSKDGDDGIKGLKKETENAKAAKTKVEEEVRSFTEQLDGRARKDDDEGAKGLKKEVEEAKSTKAKLEEEMGKLDAEIKKLTAGLGITESPPGLRNEVFTLDEKKKTLTADIEKLSKELGLKRGIEGLDAQAKSLQSLMDQRALEVARMNTKLADLSKPKVDPNKPNNPKPLPRTKLYTVKSGDFGGKLAGLWGIDLDLLKQLNPDVVWNNLQINSTLNVPSWVNI